MNILSAIVLAGILAACNSPAENLSGSGNGGGEISGEKNVVKAYVTTSDRSHLFTEKDLEFNRPASMSPYIVNLDFDRTCQTVDGFGAAVTGATSYNLMKMQQEDRTAFLKDIFDREEGLGSSLIRVSIGASDFPAGRKEFTWCDTEGIENFAPHSTAMSCSSSFWLSPKPGALVATTLNVPRSLLTTSVEMTSFSKSSATSSSGLLDCRTCSSSGRIS